MSNIIQEPTFAQTTKELRALMAHEGRAVHTGTWQGMDISKNPSAQMFELMHVRADVNLLGNEHLDHWQADIAPNLPWADDHFAERVSGQPLNPPPSWAWWPWARSAASHRTEEKFNHTYPERYWPKHAGQTVEAGCPLEVAASFAHVGIRHSYGDLNDVVSLLVKDPRTRQAYLPIFFPEDTGIGDGGRKPCSLGYQFIMRRGQLDVFYPMRSVDLIRHFQDDCYLTVRLLLWVLEECRKQDKSWNLVRPGMFVMHMTSLHCFVNDQITLRKEAGL